MSDRDPAADREPLRFHRVSEQVAVPALERRSTRVQRIRPIRQLVVATGHPNRSAGFQIIEREIDRRPAIVSRSLRRIRHEHMLVGRSAVPEHLRDVPRPIGIVNEQSITKPA